VNWIVTIFFAAMVSILTIALTSGRQGLRPQA
jgi:hypothetical protein